jgi:hypothetical protein
MHRLVILLGYEWDNESFENMKKFTYVLTTLESQSYVTNFMQ